MRQREFWSAVTVDETGFLDRFLTLLEIEQIAFCVIGGQAVNAYVEPLVSLDLDVAIAEADLDHLVEALGYAFDVERFEHTLNVRSPGSDLRVQFQLDPRYAAFVERAEPREVLGHLLPVARVEDVLAGKTWAASDPKRRPSKRLKDLADLARLVESYPELLEQVPLNLRSHLV